MLHGLLQPGVAHALLRHPRHLLGGGGRDRGALLRKTPSSDTDAKVPTQQLGCAAGWSLALYR